MELLTREVPATFTPNGSGRIRSAVVATENAVAVYDRIRGGAVLEILLLDGARIAESVPLLTDHAQSVRSTIGTAGGFRRNGNDLGAQLRFASGTVASDEAWALIEGGHVRGLSVGYYVTESTMVPAGRSEVIRGREFRAPAGQPLRVATSWTLKEVSLTPLPADESAGIRSDNLFQRRNRVMSIATHDYTQERANAQTDKALQAMRFHLDRNDAIRWPELLAHGLQAIGREVPEGPGMIVRGGLSTPAVSDAITTLATVRVGNAFNAVPDSLAGIRTVIDLENFKAVRALVASGGGRLESLERGGAAEDLWFGIAAETIRLKRYAARVVFDEQDLVDQAEGVNRQLLGVDEMGRAPKRLVLDLAWALLLSNPTLATDSKAVFHTDHSNYGTGGGSALGQGSLATAMAAIAGQTIPDDEANAVHLNIPARHLRVAPVLLEPARRLARDIALNDGADLSVMAESRLGPTGFVDPTSDEVVQGSDTAWMLAGPGEVAPSLLVGAMGGRLEPKIRSGQLEQGAWGLWFDCVLDVGVAMADYRPLYFAAGA